MNEQYPTKTVNQIWQSRSKYDGGIAHIRRTKKDRWLAHCPECGALNGDEWKNYSLPGKSLITAHCLDCGRPIFRISLG